MEPSGLKGAVRWPQKALECGDVYVVERGQHLRVRFFDRPGESRFVDITVQNGVACRCVRRYR